MSNSNWLEEWLQELNLSDYYNILLQRDLTTPDTLSKLDKSQLKEYGITKPGHLNRLHKAILKLNCDSTDDSPPLSSSPPPVLEVGAPPVPIRKGTLRRSRSPNTLSVTEEVLRDTLEQPQHVPHRVHSLRKKPSDTNIKMDDNLVNKPVVTNNVTTSPPIETDQSNSPVKSSKRYENVGIKSFNKTSSPKPPPRQTPPLSLDREITPPPIIPPQRSGPINPPLTAPTVASYDTILKGEVWSQSLDTPAITTYESITELNTNNLATYETIGETLPPTVCGDNLYEIIPAIKSNNTNNTTATPTSNIYDRLTAKEEVKVQTNVPSLSPPLFIPSLPPSEESIHLSVSPSISPPPPRVSSPPPVTSLPSFSPPLPPRELSPPPVTSLPPPLPPRELSPPPVTSLPSFSPPLPPRELSPPPVTSLPPPLPPRELSPPPVSSLPPCSPPLPPWELSPPPVTSLPPPLPPRELSPPPVSSLPPCSPPLPPRELSPPSVSSLLPSSPPLPPADDILHVTSVPNFSPPPPPMETLPMAEPHVPTNLVDDISSPGRDSPPRKFHPPVPPNRKSSLIPEGETVIDSSTSPPVPPITISPVPPISQQGEDNSNPIPPPIPKRGTLPPPPPPPITYDDHPECMMQDPESYSISTYQKEARSSVSDESGSCTPGSPLSPISSTVQIQQLSCGSDSCIGLTPPINRVHMTDSDYSYISDSDSDISPYGTPLLSGTLKDVQLRLEPLKEDTLLPTNNDYETIPSKPPQPKPRPKSTFVEERKNNLFASFENSTGQKDNLTMSYNASYKPSSSPVRKKIMTSPVTRHIPSTQSVKDLAKDLERQTLRHANVPRSKTETDVTDGRQSTVPPTVEGFLHKKGGKKNERPYQKRWVVFDGEELKYFRTKGEKEIDARNNVKLSEMIDVKRVADPDQTNRFDLVVINRVFQFFSDKEDNAQLWVNVLHAAISKFNPSDENDHSLKEGGNMNSPDKQGFILKQGHRFGSSGFKQRFVALKDSRFAYYDSKDDFISAKPIHILDMRLANVKPDMSGKANRFTITMPNQRTYIFQAANSMERGQWIEKLQEAILNAINLAPEKKEGKKGVKAADVLAQIQENPANKICGDCTAEDPSWAIVNRGIMVCINCSGVHRSMGVHISKVRSVELDVEIWTEALIQLFQNIGNANSNVFWEKYCQSEKLEASSPREIREMYIRTKYESKAWIPRNLGDTPDILSKALCVSVASDDLMRTTELLVTGADPCYVNLDILDTERNTPLKIAKANNQLLQVELLEQNGGLLDNCTESESSNFSTAFKKGYLYKTGSDRQGWRKRYCSVNAYRGFEYFRSETDFEILGTIKVDSMLGVSQCDQEASVSTGKHCFEVITPGRPYLFASESDADMNEWIDTIKEITPKDNADKLGYDKVGFLTKRSPQNVGWKKRWFSLKSKKLTYFKNSKEEIASIDMKMVVSIKEPEQGSFESMCSFQIVVPERVYHLRADNPTEAESWVQALKQTQVSVKLSEQMLTSGAGIPILVHKCLEFVETHGLELEGVYRKSGEKSKSTALLQLFNQDPRTVMIDSCVYTVHDVTGTLKKFLKGLPDPLLTHQFYQAFIDAAVMTDHETKLHQLQSLIDQLPLVNKETLKRIINHLLKIVQNESSNKMSQSNLTSLFGPTLMTVDGDPISFEDMQAQYSCIQHMMSYYKWLFNAEGEEEKKEEKMQEAMKKLEAAKEQHKQQAHVSGGMNTSTSFLISIYIGGKDGVVCGMKATLTTTAAEVVEFVTTTKNLPPTNYCVYLVLGDTESERPLHSLEQVLAVQTTDSYLCLKPNTLADKIKDYDSYSGQCVMLHLMEKKKWKKYPCSVRNKYFIVFKDTKCQTELHKIPMFDSDLFIGIERRNIDVRNPLPTKYPLSLLVRVKDNSKFLCADSPADRLLITAAVILSQHPDGIQTPVMPLKSTTRFFDARNRGISILAPRDPSLSHHPAYGSYKSKTQIPRTHIPKRNVSDGQLVEELTHRTKSTSPERF